MNDLTFRAIMQLNPLQTYRNTVSICKTHKGIYFELQLGILMLTRHQSPLTVYVLSINELCMGYMFRYNSGVTGCISPNTVHVTGHYENKIVVLLFVPPE